MSTAFSHWFPPLVDDHGDPSAPVWLVGEAPGSSEEAYNEPFVGASGKELYSMLEQAGFDTSPAALYKTNVFPIRPDKNDVNFFFTRKADGVPVSVFPPMGQGKYLHPDFRTTVELLRDKARQSSPALILAFGNTALWALTGLVGIGARRGTLRRTHNDAGALPLMATYHPSMVLRQYSLRTMVVADLIKAHDFLTGANAIPEHTEFRLHLNPTRDQLPLFIELARSAPELAVDVETWGDQIRTVGVAVSPTEAFVIPFFCVHSGVTNYWDTPEDELAALQAVIEIMTLPCPKHFQNGLFDMQRFLRPYGLAVRNPGEDTLLLAHAAQPEMKKSLDVLSSLFLNVEDWKANYRKGTNEQGKRDE